MGTKRKLSPVIKELVGQCRPGPFLDAFAGMCSVGSEVGSLRPVWSNDLQAFSNLVATALFCSAKWPPLRQDATSALMEPFLENLLKLTSMYSSQLEREGRALGAADHSGLRSFFEEALADTDHRPPPREGEPKSLFTERYAGSYFSVSQAIEIDSIRHAADVALQRRKLTSDEHRWILIATAIGMNRCTTSTGHFAQPLAPKAANLVRLIRQRGRSVFMATLDALDALRPIGSAKWRKGNRVFRSEATSLLEGFSDASLSPSIIYADPPYTDDQYSRYYHIYETWVLYDYPTCRGRGQYREDRAVSDFCLPKRVHAAFDELIRNASNLGSDLILSYPEEGVLPNSKAALSDLFVRHYGRAPRVVDLVHAHSSMGASKGTPAATPVIERLYRIAA